MNNYRIKKVLLLTFFLFACHQYVCAEKKYDVVIFGNPYSKSYQEGIATAINQNGTVVGYFHSDGLCHLFKGNSKGESEIITSTSFVYPYDINERGDIIGHAATKYNEFNFIWLSDEVFFHQFLWGKDLSCSSSLNAITNDRIIVGTIGNASLFYKSGVVFEIFDIDSKKLTKSYEASSKNNPISSKYTNFSIKTINNNGYCALNCSTHPQIDEPSKSTYLLNTTSHELVYIGEGYSICINEKEEVLCKIRSNNCYDHYIWKQNEFTKIEAFTPTSFNNCQEIIGHDTNGHGIISSQGTIYKLTDLIDEENFDILRIEYPSAINDKGMISARAILKVNDKEKRVAILLTPKDIE